MKAAKIPIRRIGNSRGVLIPKAILDQIGADSELSLSIKDGAIVLENPAAPILTKSDLANLEALLRHELDALLGGWLPLEAIAADVADIIELFAQGNHEKARVYLRERRKEISKAIKQGEG